MDCTQTQSPTTTKIGNTTSKQTLVQGSREQQAIAKNGQTTYSTKKQQENIVKGLSLIKWFKITDTIIISRNKDEIKGSKKEIVGKDKKANNNVYH